MSPLIIALLMFLQPEAAQTEIHRREQDAIVEQRIEQAQYCAAVEARAQHREVSRAQPASHLEPELEAASRYAAGDRLIIPSVQVNRHVPK
jgi:hypothetical protein